MGHPLIMMIGWQIVRCYFCDSGDVCNTSVLSVVAVAKSAVVAGMNRLKSCSLAHCVAYGLQQTCTWSSCYSNDDLLHVSLMLYGTLSKYAQVTSHTLQYSDDNTVHSH